MSYFLERSNASSPFFAWMNYFVSMWCSKKVNHFPPSSVSFTGHSPTVSLLFCVHCSVCVLFFRLPCSLSTSNVCVFMCQSDPLNLLEHLFLWSLNIHPQGSPSLQRSDFKKSTRYSFSSTFSQSSICFIPHQTLKCVSSILSFLCSQCLTVDIHQVFL